MVIEFEESAVRLFLLPLLLVVLLEVVVLLTVLHLLALLQLFLQLLLLLLLLLLLHLFLLVVLVLLLLELLLLSGLWVETLEVVLWCLHVVVDVVGSVVVGEYALELEGVVVDEGVVVAEVVVLLGVVELFVYLGDERILRLVDLLFLEVELLL